MLLTASPGQDTLTAYSLAVVDQALARTPRPPHMTGETDDDHRTGRTQRPPGQAVVDAAMVLLERMGLTPCRPAAVPAARPPVPTFAEYIPVVSAAVSDGCRRAYGSYWNRVTDQWGRPPYRRAHARRRSGSSS